MNLKSYNQYLNEDLNGEFNFYGSGSLYPIVQKLKSEGKSLKVVYAYLTSLGIDEDRKRNVISKVFINEKIEFNSIIKDLQPFFESSLFEDDENPSPKEIEDLLNAKSDDLERGVEPNKAEKDVTLKKSLDKLKDDKKSKDDDTKDNDNKKDNKGEVDKEDDKENSKRSNLDTMLSILKDAEKLAKIKEILKESRESNLK